MLAEQFADLDDAMDAMEGPNGSVIVGERNKVALRVLNEQVAHGKKYLGIFYGAGHLRLMEKSLEETGFKRVGVTCVQRGTSGRPLLCRQRNRQSRCSPVMAPSHLHKDLAYIKNRQHNENTQDVCERSND